ncbi:hypothetical protein ACX9H0_004742, partial [Escherichia coli]
PVSQTYNLPELIEGMEVSIDVSTCDADLGNRYFGTVTEALELDTARMVTSSWFRTQSQTSM